MSGKLVRVALTIAGSAFVGLGIVGIFLPLLPTTPFFLLAAACYARSSKRFYNWLLNNRWFGKYVTLYRAGKGVPLSVKAPTLCLLWFTITLSALFVVDNAATRAILFLIAIGVSFHVLSIPTLRK